jgi:16S rRNA (guanine527-N7)-methyltransferase
VKPPGIPGDLGLNPDQLATLERYRAWLIDEAIPGGGLGPNETDRVTPRHLEDSLSFLRLLESPSEIWDLGSGVGLPGIPIAVARPEILVTLVDRSRSRMDLAKRAVRVLGLDNVESRVSDIEKLSGPTECVVSRAAIPPSRLHDICQRLLPPGGRAVVGGSWITKPVVTGWDTIEVGSLDHPVWLLMMQRS